MRGSKYAAIHPRRLPTLDEESVLRTAGVCCTEGPPATGFNPTVSLMVKLAGTVPLRTWPLTLVLTVAGGLVWAVIVSMEKPCLEASFLSVGAVASMRCCRVVTGMDSAKEGERGPGFGTSRTGVAAKAAAAAPSVSLGKGKSADGGTTGKPGFSIQKPMRTRDSDPS